MVTLAASGSSKGTISYGSSRSELARVLRDLDTVKIPHVSVEVAFRKAPPALDAIRMLRHDALELSVVGRQLRLDADSQPEWKGTTT